MAQFNLTLDHDELLELLTGNREIAFKHLVEKILNTVLIAESAEQLKTGKYERSDERTDYRNGSRERPFTTRIGQLVLEVPRHRNQPFHTMLFETYQRNETALINTMVEMVVSGVSTRKVDHVVELICGENFSKSTVSEVCKRLDPEIENFRNRRLDDCDCPFLMVDATYFKVREDHKIISKALMVALGYSHEGKKEVLYFKVYDAENEDNWSDFFQHLKTFGLKEPLMLTSDAHPAIRLAANKVYPGTPWQRCQFHFKKNVVDAAPKKYRAGLELELREMFCCTSIEAAREKRDSILKDYNDVAEKSMEILENGFEDSMTVLLLPVEMRTQLRTSNALERLNGELKRRSDVIRIFPNASSLLRLMGAVIIDYNDSLSVRKQAFYKSSFAKITTETKIRLQKLALEQEHLLQAA